MQTFLTLHGVNHNMFGKRDPKQYGTVTLAEIDGKLQALAKELGAQVTELSDQQRGRDVRAHSSALRRQITNGKRS